jgi:hypothetical protein
MQTKPSRNTWMEMFPPRFLETGESRFLGLLSQEESQPNRMVEMAAKQIVHPRGNAMQAVSSQKHPLGRKLKYPVIPGESPQARKNRLSNDRKRERRLRQKLILSQKLTYRKLSDA